MKLSEIIKNKRLDLELSQRELANLININYSYIAKIENDRAVKPSLVILIKLSNALKIDLYYLLEVSGYTKEEILILNGKINLLRKNLDNVNKFQKYIIKTEMGTYLDIAKILNDFKNENISLEETIHLIHYCQPELFNNKAYYPTYDKMFEIEDL